MIPSTKLNIAVVAPMPIARVTIAAIANPGLRTSWRSEKVRSCRIADNTSEL
jgi:hypothetical protein